MGKTVDVFVSTPVQGDEEGERGMGEGATTQHRRALQQYVNVASFSVTIKEKKTKIVK